MSDHPHFPDTPTDTPIEVVDLAVADVMVPQANRTPVTAAGALTDLSDQEPLYAAAAGVLATGLVMRDGRLWRAGTRILASHLLATALRGIVKHLVDRTRPEAAARRGAYELGKGRRHEKDFNSFPSGHTAGAVAVARAVSRDFPGAAATAGSLTATVGAMQVVRSHHYVSDVAAGAAIGFVSEALVAALIRRAERI